MNRAATMLPPAPGGVVGVGTLAILEVCLEACELRRIHDLPRDDDGTRETWRPRKS